MKYGYARVSTEKQCLNLQIDALNKAECDQIFSEKVSTRKTDRKQLKKFLSVLNSGDTVVCYKLDRLGRSLRELLDLMTSFEDKKVRFISIADGINTKTLSSKLILNIMMCIADFERELIRERTVAGLEAAKSRGVKLGRSAGVDPKYRQLQKQAILLYEKGLTPTEIHRNLRISRPSVYKYLRMAAELT